MRLVDNEVVVALKEKTTTLKVKAGWNYIALDVNHIYEFSYVTMYHRSEYTTTAPYYSKYYTFFRGFYDETEDDEGDKGNIYHLLSFLLFRYCISFWM